MSVSTCFWVLRCVDYLSHEIYLCSGSAAERLKTQITFEDTNQDKRLLRSSPVVHAAGMTLVINGLQPVV